MISTDQRGEANEHCGDGLFDGINSGTRAR